MKNNLPEEEKEEESGENHVLQVSELTDMQWKTAHEIYECLRTMARRCQSWGWDCNNNDLSKRLKTCHIFSELEISKGV